MDKWTRVKSGKVRDVWLSENGRLVALVASDEVSANDERTGVCIREKGKLLTKFSMKWFRLTEGIVPNALITTDVSDMPSCFQNKHFKERTTEMYALKMTPIEAVVRGYITGTMWSKYKNGERRISDYDIPEGLLESQKLTEPIYTPTTKSPYGEHDITIDFERTVKIIEEAGFSEPRKIAKRMRDYSLELYSICSKYALEHGVILADTKFEFGVDSFGILRVADEICTPDSSRFWLAKNFEAGRSQEHYSTFIIREYVKCMATETNKRPYVPIDIVEKTERRYYELYRLLFG